MALLRRPRLRALGGIADTAVLVFVVLVVALIAWKLLLGIAGLLWTLARLAALAVVIALAIRTWYAFKRRGASPTT